ncbi:MAG TPA: hypothetical protein VKP30_19845, partial [Polyangiaceae bacterium]|nr:hypothetical protein [Polyangiaceae bacterium]
MRPTKFWQILAAWALFSSIGAAQAHVGDLSTLRDIARAAHDNFQRRNYPMALGQFLSVWSKIKVPAVAYWVAQAYEQLGDRGKAALFYAVASQLAKNEFWSDELVQLKAKTDATIRLNLVRQRVPQSLRLELTGNSA